MVCHIPADPTLEALWGGVPMAVVQGDPLLLRADVRLARRADLEREQTSSLGERELFFCLMENTRNKQI